MLLFSADFILLLLNDDKMMLFNADYIMLLLNADYIMLLFNADYIMLRAKRRSSNYLFSTIWFGTMEVLESPSTIFEAIIKPFVNIIQAQQDKIENVHLV
jgi:hypothetical protein